MGSAQRGPSQQFYRRTLPEGCVEFSSEEGKQIFREALSSGYMDCYFKLAAQFRTQDEPAFCGLSTLVMVLNALSVDPGRVWKGPWRWYHESMLDCCMSLSAIQEQGITFDNFVCLAECNYLIAKSMRANESFSEEEFRDLVKQTTQQDERVLVLSYTRKALKQTGDGHFSPIGGYHEGRDLALVLDTARFKYPPHWVPITTLVTAMKGLDKDTGKPRGYIVLSRDSELSPLLLFRVSPLLSVTLRNGLAPEIISFVGHWLQWLRRPAEADREREGVVREMVLELLKVAPGLSEHASILTSQLNIKCPEFVSPGHLCAVKSMLKNIEELDIYETLSRVIHDFVSTASKDVLRKVCMAAGVCEEGKAQCCELQSLLTPSYFFTVLLLSWPYKFMSKSDVSNAAVLQSVAQSCIEQSSTVLQNEVRGLKQQLNIVLKLYCKESKCYCNKSA